MHVWMSMEDNFNISGKNFLHPVEINNFFQFLKFSVVLLGTLQNPLKTGI